VTARSSATRAARHRRPWGAAAGIVADRVLGEPTIQPHPVAVLGRALHALEGRLYADNRRSGMAHAAIGTGMGWAAGRVLGSTALATYVSVAGRALVEAAEAVDLALRAGDVEEARRLLPALVGRDPASLDVADICRAVVESVAENTVDAVVAPAFWAAIAGAPGACAHRAINTMDSMIGHRTTRYDRYGWAAAKLDDVVAWLPARLTAALVATCRPSAAGNVIRTVRRDAPAHPSPNAGVAEAAFAAALGLRLGGPTCYATGTEARPYLGDGRAAERQDIARATALSRDVALSAAGMLAMVGRIRTARP
jgi:adenosylcobinamide-phosphate synthase